VLVTADVDNRTVDAKGVNEAILAEFRPLTAQDERLKIHAGGQFEETIRSFRSIRKSALLAVILMYLILASLFRSYAQPLVVLAAVLFGAMGMVLGLVVCGYPFSVVTAVAMVGLFGVVVNDALILLDFINAERRRGTPLRPALHAACHTRARPIFLTTATTVVALAPMALGLGGYSKIWSPFAMSMCWGLTLATGLTLVLTPALYLIMEDAKAGAARLWRRQRHEQTTAAAPP
jgi:multidrug efflux pump subunit AcrB